ncbi:hypothetical protein IZ6_04430 [Terrihabitans soli]|uniref:DUF924 domain-containing protein n=1 Tax=Terrihabitans soli TaxID=708113 RepID=A0A6S6QTD3_9HYPH|nr:DUF924 family protein [Terrihabitans soli]BCJ89708.1 hypothetical protein IZ6_04430 [Terrihabitans soli]
MTTNFRSPEAVDPRAVIAYWRAAGSGRWFRGNAQFDAETGRRLGSLYYWAGAGMLDHLAKTAEGALALVILLDQVPRNMFRGTARAFATDGHARDIARYALSRGFDSRVNRLMRTFFYLPFMHSEDEIDQELCLALYKELGDKESLQYAKIHFDIIQKFGRFPHRNDALGRPTSTAEEQFLAAGGFSG